MDKHKISLLAFDLDGTLLNSAHEISPFTLQTIRTLMAKGVRVTISTGRTPAMQQAYIALLGLKGPYMASNGALIIDSRDNSLLHSQPISETVLRDLCVYGKENQLHLCLQALETFFITRENPRLKIVQEYDRVAAKFGMPPVPLRELTADYSNYDNSPTYKVLLYVPEEDKHRRLVSYLDQVPHLVYTFSEPNLFEVTPRGTDKGAGIRRIADFHGIPLEEVCSFGDYDNDIPIFALAGVSVAMGNASPRLKARAMYITDTNDDDGIGKALEALKGCF